MKRILKKISVLALLFVFSVAAFGLGGCGRQEAVQAPAAELVVGVGEDANKPDFAEIGVLSPNANVCESLVKLSPEFKAEPLLATKWEYTGGNTWRFTLRRGVKFHNGREFTADAVKYTFEQAMRPTGKSMLHLKEVKVVDKYTVEIVTAEPNMVVPEIITHPLYGIRCPGTDPAARPVGTGPFKFTRYEKDKELVVEKNPAYWGTPARLDRITFKYIPDANTRIMALKAGEVDVIKEIPREMVGQLSKEKGIQVLASPPGGIYIVFEVRMNKPDSAVADKRVRQALAYAINRRAIVDEVWEGNAAVGRTWLPAGMLGGSGDLIEGFQYEPEKAKRLLEEAGWKPGPDGIRVKSGRRLTLTIISGFPSAAELKPVPEVVQQQFKDVGVEARIIEVSDEGVYEDLLKKGEGDLWLTKGNQNNADPTFGPQLLHHSKGYYGEMCGNPWWGGEEFDRLIDAARTTADPGERTRLVAEALDLLIDRKTVVIPIASLANVYGGNGKVRDLTPHPADVNTRWENVSVR